MQNGYNFISQGAGEYSHGHRCAGEWLTVEVIKSALKMLTTGMTYQVPDQDLGIRLSRMPAIVQSRFVINRIHSTSAR